MAVDLYWLFMSDGDAQAATRIQMRSLRETAPKLVLVLVVSVQVAHTTFSHSTSTSSTLSTSSTSSFSCFHLLHLSQMLSSIVAEALANRMFGKGLFGQGGVQWVIGDGLSPSDFDELSADARAALHGSLQIKAVGAVDDNPRWAAFADERWAGLRPEQFNPVMPTAWQIQPDFFSSVDPRASAQLRDIGTFEYDAVMAAGLLACRVAPTGPLPADFGTQFWDAKESLTFEGLSGRVEFDEIGNRKQSSANVQLLNLLNGGSGLDGLATHCPCIDEHPPGSFTLVNGVIKRNLSGWVYDYPSNYGLSSCNSHDAGLSPSCDHPTASGQLDPGANPGWCSSRWCYVDKDACTTVAEQSDYFKGSDLQACGQEDFYSIEVLDRREFSSTSLAQLQDGAWVWEGNGTAMSSGAIFNTGETTLPYILDLAILQRMSDARFPSPELCGATFVNDTCWLDNSWQTVAVAALTAVADFNGRFGMHAPALSELAGCDKKLGLRLMDSAFDGHYIRPRTGKGAL